MTLVFETRWAGPVGRPRGAGLYHTPERLGLPLGASGPQAEGAEPIFRQALDFGITFWDTANIYGMGSSEDIVGHALKKYPRRDDIVLATKVFFPLHQGPGGSGPPRRRWRRRWSHCTTW